MKIVADENIPFVEKVFSHFGKVITVCGREIQKDTLEDATMLLVRSVTQVNKELLEGSSIKFVASATIGVDHIDTNYLHENSIGFAYSPGSNAESVAEYTIAAIIHLAEKTGKSLTDLTLGIIGVGSIGSRVYRFAEALGINCLLNDPPKKRLTGSDRYISLDRVITEADIITLHVPLNTGGEDSTLQMANDQFISRMKKGAFLINTSRGKIVDEKSVLAAKDILGGIVFDVWEDEPYINKEILNIVDIGTPHIAGHSYEGKVRGTRMIYDGACAYFFKRNDWSLPNSIITDIVDRIDISSSRSPIRDSILGVYKIFEDSEKFKENMKNNNLNDSAAIFDKFRKNYKHRHEFSRYLVNYSSNQEKEAQILSSLGFQVASKNKK